MTFKIAGETEIGRVSLKVADLDKMKHYYHEVIGLDILKETDRELELGIREDGEVLVSLKQLDQAVEKKTATGLYHLALLLPSRKDLGNFLKRFQANQYGITGSADHGYSEALYLYDPELNGIEIYADKDRSQWDIRENGIIEGVTERMDAEGVLAAADEEPIDRLPVGTKMGHVHLQVSDLEKSRYFLGEVLGLSLKSDFNGQALFYAAGDYHHHIGNNIWRTQDKPAADQQAPGLDYFEILTPCFEDLKDHLETVGVAYELLSDQELSVTHPDQIEIHVKKQ